ncbi:MAG: hydrogenase maturation protease [Planctomycetes bacterium]|nr:hydrogenase maturation protease [Planctomycetota bacterium]
MTYQSKIDNRKSSIVIGLGNPLMSDEGIGVLLAQKLAEKSQNQELAGGEIVEFYDGGVGGLNLLYKIENRDKVILIDCAKMGEPPGTIRRFTPDQVRSVKNLGHFSLHEVDILKVLDLAGQLDAAPKEVVIFGIEPASLDLNPTVSDILAGQVDTYLAAITEELKET